MLIRSWNLFHGNTIPPGRRAYLREMIELVTADHPDVVCLQEVPGWALGRLGGWSEMTEVSVLARRPTLGPLPIPARLGGALTSAHHGILRSAFSGQANAILVSPELSLLSVAHARIDDGARGRERRVAQLIELDHGVTVTNVHCTNSPDPAICDAELEVALAAAAPGRVAIVAGDFNVTPEHSALVSNLGSAPLAGSIDQIIVRGAETAELRAWPAAEREYAGRLLSDHAPVELTMAL